MLTVNSFGERRRIFADMVRDRDPGSSMASQTAAMRGLSKSMALRQRALPASAASRMS